MTGQLALDLRTDEQADLEARLAAFRKHLDQDWRNPGRHTRIRLGNGDVRKGTRCLRCAKPIMPYDRITSHDCGWCGCFGIDEQCFQYIRDEAKREAAFFARADRAMFDDCAACHHPWGLHLGSAGAWLPNTKGCDYCVPRCRGYIPPPGAVTPWGTCPGCWAKPIDDCRCVQ